MANRGMKFRIEPTDEQKILLAKTFGCRRFIYNKMLESKIAYYEKEKKTLQTTPAMYKEEFPFLKEVDSLALANAQMDLQQAFANFFRNIKKNKSKKKKPGFPKFKSKGKCRYSYTTNCQKDSIAIIDNEYIKLPKLKLVKAIIHREIPADWVLKSATVSMERDGTYYCSLLYEYEEQVVTKVLDEENAIGLDYKSNGLYATSKKQVCGSPKFYRKSQDQLAKEQRKLKHKIGNKKKEQASKNYRKQQLKVAKVHRKIANQRKDFLHKQSLAIAKLYDIVCVEDLDMKSQSNKGFGNGKATMDNGWGMFLIFLEYKLKDRGKILIKVDKWYPSSQICNDCGYQNKEVKNLNIKKWTCPICGAAHDRDFNAAKNILEEGLRLYQQAQTA